MCADRSHRRPAPDEPSVAGVASASPSAEATGFPTSAFSDQRRPVSEEAAAEFQAILDEAGKGGMTSTVMSADGTWSGAIGTADGTRDVLTSSGPL